MQLKANSMYISDQTILLKVLSIEIDYSATFYHVRYRHGMCRAVGPYVWRRPKCAMTLLNYIFECNLQQHRRHYQENGDSGKP